MIMLNNKETMMLNDQKKHEQLCVNKYNEYSKKASDVELKELFKNISQKEQEHLKSINQILSGTIPNVNSNNESQSKLKNIEMNSNIKTLDNTNALLDKLMCEDSLSTEKFVSSTYNTAIFEFRDSGVRQVLNHIQKEEQEHGEQIYNYMSQHGLYN